MPSLAFPKTFRLLRRAEFRRVYDHGQRRGSPLCTIFFRPNGLPHTRVGITTPRALGKAVTRNRVRRRIREVVRLNQGSLAAGWDVVVNPRALVAEVGFDKLRRELLRLFPKEPPDLAQRPAEPKPTAAVNR